MKLTYRGQIEEHDGRFVISGCRFDAEGGPLDMNEMLGLVREAWNWQPLPPPQQFHTEQGAHGHDEWGRCEIPVDPNWPAGGVPYSGVFRLLEADHLAIAEAGKEIARFGSTEDLVAFVMAVKGLCAYVLDGQVRRLDRDVLRSLAERVRGYEKEESGGS